MARSRLIAVLIFVLWEPVSAIAQTSSTEVTGLFTGHLGLVSGGDVRDAGMTPGISLAVVEQSGLGVEVDLSHARRFDQSRFAESGITMLTLNAIGLWSDASQTIRPFAVAGAGLLRVRGCVADCQVAVSRTDWGFDAGGGVFVLFSEAIGMRGEVRYLRYFQRHDDLPLINNGSFDFWRMSAGVTVAWPIR